MPTALLIDPPHNLHKERPMGRIITPAREIDRIVDHLVEQCVLVHLAGEIHPCIDLNVWGYSRGMPMVDIHACVALDITQQDRYGGQGASEVSLIEVPKSFL